MSHEPLSASRPLTLAALRARRAEILRVAAEHGAVNVRVFGSVARGETDADSDVDFLVDIERDARGFAYFGLLEDLRRGLSSVLGADVDVVDSAALDSMRERVLREAVPL
jgi:predicted nucleotidyltransferase